MDDGVLRAVLFEAQRLQAKAWRQRRVELKLHAVCGRAAWLACKMDRDIFQADVRTTSAMSFDQILFGGIIFKEDERRDVDSIQLRGEDGKPLRDFVLGERLEPAPLGNLMAGE